MFSVLEPYGSRFRTPLGAGSREFRQEEQQAGFLPMYRRNPRQRRPKQKCLDPSAPPDKDPVMLLNEYGQKRDHLVCSFSSTPIQFTGQPYAFKGN